MAAQSPSLWKQAFDAVDKRLSPTINELAKSQDVATLAALGRRGLSDLDRRLEQISRRTLHRLNMPAGSDMNRLLVHIARLEREVRDLRNQLADRENAEYLASLAARHDTKQAALPKPSPPKPAPPKTATASGKKTGAANKMATSTPRSKAG